ncbi:hypothetical protein Tco_0708713 [Tanacetum coccineum]
MGKTRFQSDKVSNKEFSKDNVQNRLRSGILKIMNPRTGGSILNLMEEFGESGADYGKLTVDGRNSGGILCVWDPSSYRKKDVTVSDYFIMIRGVWLKTGCDLLIVSGEIKAERFGSILMFQGQMCSIRLSSMRALEDIPLAGTYLDIVKDEVRGRLGIEVLIKKAPGPDVFTFGFLCRFLKVIENEQVFDANNHFLLWDIPKGCNSSFIALIPKIPDANVRSYSNGCREVLYSKYIFMVRRVNKAIHGEDGKVGKQGFPDSVAYSIQFYNIVGVLVSDLYVQLCSSAQKIPRTLFFRLQIATDIVRLAMPLVESIMDALLVHMLVGLIALGTDDADSVVDISPSVN